MLSWFSGQKRVRVRLLINKDMAGNIEQFCDIDEGVAVTVIKLTKSKKLNGVQAYAPTSSHDDQIVKSFYEDEESEISKVRTQYTVLTDDFDAKVGKKQAGG